MQIRYNIINVDYCFYACFHENNTLSIINQTAYIVWELCMDRTIDEIYTEVYQIFNNQIEINIIKKDVNMILEEFLKQSLIIEH